MKLYGIIYPFSQHKHGLYIIYNNNIVKNIIMVSNSRNMTLYDRFKNMSISSINDDLHTLLNSLNGHIATPNNIITHLELPTHLQKCSDGGYFFWDYNYNYLKNIIPDFETVYKTKQFDIIIAKCKTIVTKYQPALDTLKNIMANSFDEYQSALMFIEKQLELPAKYKTRITKRQGKRDKQHVETRNIYQIITLEDLIMLLNDTVDNGSLSQRDVTDNSSSGINRTVNADSVFVLEKIHNFTDALINIPDSELTIMCEILARSAS